MNCITLNFAYTLIYLLPWHIKNKYFTIMISHSKYSRSSPAAPNTKCLSISIAGLSCLLTLEGFSGAMLRIELACTRLDILAPRCFCYPRWSPACTGYSCHLSTMHRSIDSLRSLPSLDIDSSMSLICRWCPSKHEYFLSSILRTVKHLTPLSFFRI